MQLARAGVRAMQANWSARARARPDRIPYGHRRRSQGREGMAFTTRDTIIGRDLCAVRGGRHAARGSRVARQTGHSPRSSEECTRVPHERNWRSRNTKEWPTGLRGRHRYTREAGAVWVGNYVLMSTDEGAVVMGVQGMMKRDSNLQKNTGCR